MISSFNMFEDGTTARALISHTYKTCIINFWPQLKACLLFEKESEKMNQKHNYFQDATIAVH